MLLLLALVFVKDCFCQNYPMLEYLCHHKHLCYSNIIKCQLLVKDCHNKSITACTLGGNVYPLRDCFGLASTQRLNNSHGEQLNCNEMKCYFSYFSEWPFPNMIWGNVTLEHWFIVHCACPFQGHGQFLLLFVYCRVVSTSSWNSFYLFIYLVKIMTDRCTETKILVSLTAFRLK